jgi:glycosyltransferase involved in cell wall biosynthesis
LREELVKPAVCLFTDSLAPSGVGEHMLTLAEELLDDYALTFVCPPSTSGLRLLERAHTMGLAAVALEVRGEPRASQQLGEVLQRQGVDIFHCHAGVTWEGHDGIRAARALNGPKIVRTEHLAELTAVFRTEDLPDLIYSPYHRPDRRPDNDELAQMVAVDRTEYLRVVELVDRVICVSAGVRDSYLEVGVEPQKLRVVRNGIRPTPPVSSVRETRERLGIPLDKRVVLSVGRMIDVKGHLFVLGAVEKVIRSQPDALFLWVGGGPLQEELRERVSALDLDEHVCFAGQRSDVHDVIAAADLFLLASLVEGLPLVVLEAMAAGRPVVGTRVSGTSEVIRDGVTGRLVEPPRLDGSGDTDALAVAILESLDNPEIAACRGSAGRALFEREFTAARMARETAEVYDELLR